MKNQTNGYCFIEMLNNNADLGYTPGSICRPKYENLKIVKFGLRIKGF